MEILQHDGKTYYYDGRLFCDEFFIILEGEELRNVAQAYFGATPYKTLDSNGLLNRIKQMKACGMYYETSKVIEYAFEKMGKDMQLLYTILPIYTSCCREINQPQRGINCAEKLLPICGGSVATYTSLAAAYCDVKEYEKAKKCARIAYAKQGGGQGYKTEVSLVFKRLEKETGDQFYNEE